MALAGLLFGIGLILAPGCASRMLVLVANSKQRATGRGNRHVAWAGLTNFLVDRPKPNCSSPPIPSAT